MKTLYLDLSMGAAGDMLASALLELLPNREAFLQRLNALGLPGVTYTLEPSVKCGIRGSHLRVTVGGQEEHSHDHSPSQDHQHDHPHDHQHSHNHTTLADIQHLVTHHLPVSDQARRDILAVYDLLAQGESRVHGVPVSNIHFHEVGSLDAIADVTAVCLLMEALHPDRVTASPVHVGSGQVRCAHGILPVPAPATAELLRGIPTYGGSIAGELCTPTGAALLRHFVTSYGPQPGMAVEAVGYGCGQKDFPAANCVRAMLGQSQGREEEILTLSCNVDDMTGEEVGFALEQLLASGALDVYTTPVGMKKCRPGILLTVLCRPQDRDAMVSLLLRHTTTLGVRETACRRFAMERTVQTLETPWGPVQRKDAQGRGVSRSKLEFEDLARLAREQGISLREAAQLVLGEKEDS